MTHSTAEERWQWGTRTSLEQTQWLSTLKPHFTKSYILRPTWKVMPSYRAKLQPPSMTTTLLFSDMFVHGSLQEYQSQEVLGYRTRKLPSPALSDMWPKSLKTKFMCQQQPSLGQIPCTDPAEASIPRRTDINGAGLFLITTDSALLAY